MHVACVKLKVKFINVVTKETAYYYGIIRLSIKCAKAILSSGVIATCSKKAFVSLCGCGQCKS